MKNKLHIVNSMLLSIIFSVSVAMFAACGAPPANTSVSHQVNGVVTQVEIMPASSWNRPDLTIVHFEDGRVVTFAGISTEVLQNNKQNKITYKQASNLSGEYTWNIIVKVETAEDTP